MIILTVSDRPFHRDVYWVSFSNLWQVFQGSPACFVFVKDIQYPFLNPSQCILVVAMHGI